MSILIDEKTRVIVQGYTGDKATFHSKEMIAYGTNVVGGVTPGKGGQRHLDRPVFNTVKEAVGATGAQASLAFVPPAFSADALMEAADAGLELVCIITDGIPAQDMIRVKRYLRRYPKEQRTTLVGPNCAGIISAGKAMLGIMPGNIYIRGDVGIVSRSGTLGYEAAAQMKALGIGVTTSVGIGGDPINGSSFLDHLARFEEDPETKAVIMIGAAASGYAKEGMLAAERSVAGAPAAARMAASTGLSGWSASDTARLIAAPTSAASTDTGGTNRAIAASILGSARIMGRAV